MPASTRKASAANRALARRIAAKKAAPVKAAARAEAKRASTAAAAEIEMRTGGANKYREVSRRLKKASRGDLQRELTRAIRKEGQPALAAVRAAWMSVNVTSLPPNNKGGHARPDTSTGLRRRVAAATRIQAQQRGIKISVNGKRVDPKYPSLVFYLNGFPRGRNWRHPVFGQKGMGRSEWYWAAQRGQEVFAPTLKKFSAAWLKGAEEAMDRFVRELDR